jgi:hypothetical protein
MQCLGMATPLSKNESNEWSSDDSHRASFMYCSRTHPQVAQINGIILAQNSLSTTHAWQYREVENDCAFDKRFACQSRMSLIVELEIPKLCERNYGNRKQTSSHNEDDPPSHKFGNGHH